MLDREQSGVALSFIRMTARGSVEPLKNNNSVGLSLPKLSQRDSYLECKRYTMNPLVVFVSFIDIPHISDTL